MATKRFNKLPYQALSFYWAGVTFAGDQDVFCSGSDPVVVSVDVEEWGLHFPGVEPTLANVQNALEDAAARGALSEVIFNVVYESTKES